MTKTKLIKVSPYIGIPVIGTVLLVLRAGQADTYTTVIYLMLVIFGYIAAVFDIRAGKIPNTLILSMLIFWVLTTALRLLHSADTAIAAMIDSIIGFAIGGGIFLLVYAISRKGLGGGDVKFMAATGLHIGLSKVLMAMFYGTVFAALFGLSLILMKKMGRKDSMPLAPFLYAVILLTVFIG
jgi:Flp pilus assembly protein protease CpaA